MENSQASFYISRVFAVSRFTHLLRTVPRSIIHQAVEGYDAWVEWALASIILASDEAAAVGLLTPKKVAHLPTREDGLGGSPAANPSKARPASVVTPWAWDVTFRRCLRPGQPSIPPRMAV